jgi:hypothetical protein
MAASCVVMVADRAVSIFDADDSEIVSPYSWRLSSKKAHGYACTVMRRKTILLHRLVMQNALAASELKTPQIDHKNRNPLDNRRSNLRVSTQQQNTWNTGPIRGRQYRGISQRSNGKYRVDIQDEYVGDFVTAEDAARAYDARARILYGEFACLNFPIAQQLKYGDGILSSTSTSLENEI